MKKKYFPPEIEFIEFDIEDIITESSLAVEPGDNEFKPPDGWWK
ncbi:MAG: hypothetical protein PHD46_01515 [Eubacteriales bacterium]|nr:hypothetical protein [Eubacteriales bacterium]MDD4421694.1 hypothetical protein [Eubacteriales bacterium]